MSEPNDAPPPAASVSDAFGGTRELSGYRLARWTLAEYADMSEFIKDRRERDARVALARTPGLTPEQIGRITAELRAEPVTLRDFQREMDTPAGSRFALRLGLRQHHPQITERELADLEREHGGFIPVFVWLLGLDAITPAAGDGTEQEETDPDPPAQTRMAEDSSPSSSASETA